MRRRCSGSRMRCPRPGKLRNLRARAATGLRPPAIRPAARSLLMVSATHRRMDQPPEARPVAVMTPRWSAAGRRPSPIARRGRHRKVHRLGASRRSIPSAFPRDGIGRQAAPGLREQGRRRASFQRLSAIRCLATPDSCLYKPRTSLTRRVGLSPRQWATKPSGGPISL